jgi:pimeloyl-ACP methyl ester carboxylesterase
MPENLEWEWNPWQATRVFLAACYGDLVGYSSARKRLLGKLSIRQKSIFTGGRQIAVLEASHSEYLLPVIFLHGTPGNSVDWRWFLKKASGQYRIVAVDRPGFGPVDKAPPDLKKDKALWQEILGTYTDGEHKPILVGHSLGAGIAARLAVDYPDLVSKLVLVAAGLDPALEKLEPVQAHFGKPPLSWLLPRSVRHCNLELLQYIDFLSDLQPHLPRIKCPVTVIQARNDRLVPFSNVDYIQKHCTGTAALNIMELKSGGHFLNRTKPREILKALG